MIWDIWTKLEVDRSKIEEGRPIWFVFKPEILDWLNKMVGPKYQYMGDESLTYWYFESSTLSSIVTMYFKYPKDAILFKLVWL